MLYLEVLIQSLEDKVVTISRARGSHSFPAKSILAAAMIPWACGEQSKIGAEPGPDLVRLTKQAASKFLPWAAIRRRSLCHVGEGIPGLEPFKVGCGPRQGSLQEFGLRAAVLLKEKKWSLRTSLA